MTCAQRVGRNQRPRATCGDAQNEQYAVIRKRFMTENEEEMRKESIFTQTTLLLQ